MLPAPSPAPAVPAPAPQTATAVPGQAPANRFLGAPPASHPVASPTAPGAATVPAAGRARRAGGRPRSLPRPRGRSANTFRRRGSARAAETTGTSRHSTSRCRCRLGWTQVPDPNVPDAFAVIADRQGSSLYSSNAQVVVYKLVGDFDPREAISHGYVDSQKLLAWQPTDASLADFGGFPSSIVEGTYRDGTT